MTRLDRPASALALLGLVAAAVTAVLLPHEIEPLLVPVLFVLAGALGPLWSGARFASRALILLGALHLVCDAAIALSAGYPDGPAPRWSLILAAGFCLVPVAAVLSGPTPSILTGAGLPAMVGPVARILPSLIAQVAAIVFVLPVIAVVIAIVRAVRGGRELLGRLVLPLLALVVLAAVVGVGVLVSTGPLSTALFLVASPLVPVALVAGSRPVTEAPDPVRAAAVGTSGELSGLTPRERDVLALMAEGQSNPAIGRSLHLSLSAVEKHATSIFGKLGLLPEPDTHRRVAAVVAYLRASSG